MNGDIVAQAVSWIGLFSVATGATIVIAGRLADRSYRRRQDSRTIPFHGGTLTLPPGVSLPNGYTPPSVSLTPPSTETLVGDFTSDIQAELDRIDPPDHFEVPHTIMTEHEWGSL